VLAASEWHALPVDKKRPVIATGLAGKVLLSGNQLSRMIINPDVSIADIVVKNHLTALKALLPRLSIHFRNITVPTWFQFSTSALLL
jgi:hypothetical protein